jgi:hypothetical protein
LIGTAAQRLKKSRFLEELQQQGSVTHACRVAEVGRRTVYDWRRLDGEFGRRWDDVVESTIDELEQSAFQRAREGDTTLLIFLLKTRRPQIYGQGSRGGAPSGGRPEGVKPPTLADIFAGAGIDLANLESWKKMAEALRSYDLRDIAPLLVKVSDQMMKIQMVQARGASSGALDEIRSTRAAGMTCSQCGNTLLWWRSRTGHRLCMRCHPDPWQALEAFLRAMAQGCAEVAEAGRPS